MTQAVTDVTASSLDSFDPVVEIQFAVEVNIAATQADALAVDTREVGLAADTCAIAAIQGVVPDIELPIRWRIDRRDEVAGAVGDVHEVFIGADAVHHRQDVIG